MNVKVVLLMCALAISSASGVTLFGKKGFSKKQEDLLNKANEALKAASDQANGKFLVIFDATKLFGNADPAKRGTVHIAFLRDFEGAWMAQIKDLLKQLNALAKEVKESATKAMIEAKIKALQQLADQFFSNIKVARGKPLFGGKTENQKARKESINSLEALRNKIGAHLADVTVALKKKNDKITAEVLGVVEVPFSELNRINDRAIALIESIA